ncbi:MAG: DUF2917 domain-containing protein [Burkholderiaceae bacterium]
MSVSKPILFSSSTLAGAWSLRSGSVMSLHPGRASLLRIAQGTAWVTVGAPDGGTPEACGDFFLHSGQALCVPAGARVVLEAEGRCGGLGALRFDWGEQPTSMGRFAQALARPTGELKVALRQVRLALVEIFKGLQAYVGSLAGARRSRAAPYLVAPHRP